MSILNTPSYQKEWPKIAESFSKVSREEQLSVVVQVNSELSRQAAENRLNPTSVIEIILIGGRKGLPLPGGSGSGNVVSQDLSVNEGNVLALLGFREQVGDTMLQKHVEGGHLDAHYVSVHIQNKPIELCGDTKRKDSRKSKRSKKL